MITLKWQDFNPFAIPLINPKGVCSPLDSTHLAFIGDIEHIRLWESYGAQPTHTAVVLVHTGKLLLRMGTGHVVPALTLTGRAEGKGRGGSRGSEFTHQVIGMLECICDGLTR